MSVTELLLRFSKEARHPERADESLFGRFCRNTWRSGSGALDSRQLARHLRRVLTLHHRAHAGGRGEAVNLRPAVTGFVTIQVRLGVFGTSTGNTIGYPFDVGVRPNSSDENSQPAGDFADPSTKP